MAQVIEQAQETIENIASKPIKEGEMTKLIERQTAKIPSVFFLNLGIASILASLGFAVAGERYRKTANFIGLWVPTLLIMGIYNKLVKLEGSDRYDHA
jgi:hypothetical protein